MKNKAKWFLLIVVGVLLVASLLGCATRTPRLTEQQVISVIHVYGVPYTSWYYNQKYPEDSDWYFVAATPCPVGEWAAVHTGHGNWTIQGAVVASHQEWKWNPDKLQFEPEDRTIYGSTTWTFSEETKEIKLIWFSGSGWMTKAWQPTPSYQPPTGELSYEDWLKEFRGE